MLFVFKFADSLREYNVYIYIQCSVKLLSLLIILTLVDATVNCVRHQTTDRYLYSNIFVVESTIY